MRRQHPPCIRDGGISSAAPWDGSAMPDDDKPDRNDPISLAPLTPEEALRALLAVRPEDQSVDNEPPVLEQERIHKDGAGSV